jgi:hypothetical protein
MSSISSGNFAKIVLNPGETYRVVTGGTATVEAIYGAPNGTTTVTANSVTFGPYGVNAKLKVTATSGPCDVFKVEKVPLEAYPDGSLDPAGAGAVVSTKNKLSLQAWLLPGVSEQLAMERAIQFAYDDGGAEIIVPRKSPIGGVVQAYMFDSIKPRRDVVIDANGQTLKLNNGINASLVTLYDDDSVNWTLKNGIIDGNTYANTFAGSCIELDRLTIGDVSGRYYDSWIRLDGLTIKNAKDYGVLSWGNQRENRFTNLRIVGCKGKGIYNKGSATRTVNGTPTSVPGSTDNFFFLITSYQNTNGNFQLEGANLKGIGLKSFGAGDAENLASTGIEFRGCRRSTFTAVESQEEGGNGVVFSTDSNNNSVFGLITDANGTSDVTGSKYCLAFIDQSYNNVVERYSQGNFKPGDYNTEGVYFSTTGSANSVNGTSSTAIAANKFVTAAAGTKLDNKCVLNNTRLFGVESPDQVVTIRAEALKAVTGTPSDATFGGGRRVGLAFDQATDEQACATFVKPAGFDKITVVVEWVSASGAGVARWFCDLGYFATGASSNAINSITSAAVSGTATATDVLNRTTLPGAAAAYMDLSSVPDGSNVYMRVKRIASATEDTLAADAIVANVYVTPYLT